MSAGILRPVHVFSQTRLEGVLLCISPISKAKHDNKYLPLVLGLGESISTLRNQKAYNIPLRHFNSNLRVL